MRLRLLWFVLIEMIVSTPAMSHSNNGSNTSHQLPESLGHKVQNLQADLEAKGYKVTRRFWDLFTRNRRKGMGSKFKRALRWLMLAALCSASLTVTIIATTRPALAFGTDGLFSEIHERITRNAFPFMTSGILNAIVAGNLDEDEGDAADLAERHAQNCRFRDSATYINARYRQVVEALREPQAADPNRAARLFGHILHGAQDFYSHSNWIPTPPQGLGIRGRLFDSSLGLWGLPAPYSILFDDVVVIEGDPPAGVSVRLPADANGRVSSAVPIVQDRRIFAASEDVSIVDRTVVGSSGTIADGRQLRGLMTSAAPRHPGDQLCPPVGGNCNIDSPDNVCLRHGDKRSAGTSKRTFDGAGYLNLDGGGGGDWFDARHHARLQTRHEWCRLLHLSRVIDPTFVAPSRLLATWVGTDTGVNTPHIPGTPCERGAARRHLVEISATPGRNAPSNVPFVVFRSDFTSSARATVARQTTKTLKICGNTSESIIAALMPAGIKGATLLVPVPGIARSWSVRDHRGAFDVTFVIKVTPNSC
jgi:hypothetical protein